MRSRCRCAAVFERAGREAALADDDAMRDADQLDVGEHRPGTQAAIVEHDFDAGVATSSSIKLFGFFAHGRVLVRVDRADRDAPRRHRLRPDDAGGVVVLLDRRGDDAADADAVAAHLHHARLAGVVEHGRAHRLGVFLAELEHVADFDAARDLQRAVAVGRRIAFDDLADVGDARDARVALPVRAAIMRAVLVAAADEIGERRRRCGRR